MMEYAIWGLSALVIPLGCVIVALDISRRHLFWDLIDSDEDNARLQEEYRSVVNERDRLSIFANSLVESVHQLKRDKLELNTRLISIAIDNSELQLTVDSLNNQLNHIEASDPTSIGNTLPFV